ncbi:adenylyltransferase and sulfurtransferase [Metschnikowia aff. pulcherrima]|uniref:Adenylyltransferase and sulfurtransferase n=1 Tax=Metschnikowia aff. pulcherrima TaxID=2163413 RepID=A0A4P6XRF4_9ASCO|nr:adenylyltransferase and sulfurtransferase [Metschnikowia aff. pulcherrima]
METEIENLRKKVAELEAENRRLKGEQLTENSAKNNVLVNETDTALPMSLEEYRRYGRQMIVPGFGSLESQLKLRNAKVLAIGAGGLGCPALLYLCGAGIGKIGILDNDVVDESNLHRQVLHTTTSVGKLKCDSAKEYLLRLNPHVDLATHPVRLLNENAFDIISMYDLVVDCTDTPATRYLINDVCVILGKTIVSGSGVKTDGQITILNYKNTGPCYRCFHPKPPTPDSVPTCSEAGVLGPAIGLTGIALATETIKVVSDFYKDNFTPFIAMYSAFPQQSMRVFKMRNRQASCAACGDKPSILKKDIESGLLDYSAFCGQVTYNVLPAKNRLSVSELQQRMRQKGPLLLLDVRPKDQFEITSLPNALNVDWERTLSKCNKIEEILPADFDKQQDEVYVMCRFGNDSQLAAQKLMLDFGLEKVYDVKGGINKWSCEVDKNVPIY